MRVASIDIGTNSVLLLVAERDGAGTLCAVLERARVTRLGAGVDRTRQLAPEAVERTLACLGDYAADLRRLGVTRLDVVGTSAMRDASAGELFVARAGELLGVAPRVVSGDEEARLTFEGALVGLDLAGALSVFDVGGGSTEIVRGTRDGASATVLEAVSLDVGSVRLTERHVRSDPPTRAELDAVRADVARALEGATRPRAGEPLVGTNRSEELFNLGLGRDIERRERLGQRLAAACLLEHQRHRLELVTTMRDRGHDRRLHLVGRGVVAPVEQLTDRRSAVERARLEGSALLRRERATPGHDLARACARVLELPRRRQPRQRAHRGRCRLARPPSYEFVDEHAEPRVGVRVGAKPLHRRDLQRWGGCGRRHLPSHPRRGGRGRRHLPSRPRWRQLEELRMTVVVRNGHFAELAVHPRHAGAPNPAEDDAAVAETHRVARNRGVAVAELDDQHGRVASGPPARLDGVLVPQRGARPERGTERAFNGVKIVGPLPRREAHRRGRWGLRRANRLKRRLVAEAELSLESFEIGHDISWAGAPDTLRTTPGWLFLTARKIS